MDVLPSIFIKIVIATVFGATLLCLLLFGITYEKTNNFFQYANGVFERGGSVNEINEESVEKYSGAFKVEEVEQHGYSLGKEITYTVSETINLPTVSNNTVHAQGIKLKFHKKANVLYR